MARYPLGLPAQSRREADASIKTLHRALLERGHDVTRTGIAGHITSAEARR